MLQYAELLVVPLISLALLIPWLQCLLFLEYIFASTPWPLVSAIKVIFIKVQFKSFFCFCFFSPKKRFVSRRGNPFWGLLYLEFKVRNRFVLSCFLSILSLLFEVLSWPSFLKLCVPRTLDSFLMVHNLPLKPRVRIIYFTTLLDYKLLEDKDWGINPYISPEGTVTYSRGPKWEQNWITM